MFIVDAQTPSNDGRMKLNYPIIRRKKNVFIFFREGKLFIPDFNFLFFAQINKIYFMDIIRYESVYTV